MEEYSDKDLLVEVTWLVSNISDPNIVVIDCDSGDAYSRGHIPGSVHLPTHMYVKSAKDKLFVMDDEEFSSISLWQHASACQRFVSLLIADESL